jgi:hypothetical protein
MSFVSVENNYMQSLMPTSFLIVHNKYLLIVRFDGLVS